MKDFRREILLPRHDEEQSNGTGGVDCQPSDPDIDHPLVASLPSVRIATMSSKGTNSLDCGIQSSKNCTHVIGNFVRSPSFPGESPSGSRTAL